MRVIQREIFILDTTDIENLANQLGWKILSQDKNDIVVGDDNFKLEYGNNGWGYVHAPDGNGDFYFMGKIDGECDERDLLDEIEKLVG